MSRDRGRRAEDAALDFLRSAGLDLVSRNYTCRMGEIDLVMSDGAVLVFVEVRARAPTRFASPEESVGPRKRARLSAAARHFISTHPAQADRPMRFDVVAISGDGPENRPRWLRAAFDAAGAD